MQIYHLFCDPKPTLAHHSRANVIVTHSLNLNSYSEGKKILCTLKIVNKRNGCASPLRKISVNDTFKKAYLLNTLLYH